MRVIFITAKPKVMPDSSDLGNWQPIPNAKGFYVQTIGDTVLFAHVCLSEMEIRWNLKKKHATIASWVNTVLSYISEHLGDFDKDNFFLILHDKDLLKYPSTDEGIYREKKIIDANGGLEGMLKDGNIYLFQHVPTQDMSEALINELSEPCEENIEQAIAVIKNCTYEA